MVLLIGLLACASSSSTQPGALGWSLGGEAHVFVASDRFARDLYHELTGRGGGGLADTLAQRPLIAVEARRPRYAIVLSASGEAPARLTLARFHAPRRCGFDGIVSELVLAFQPGGRTGPRPPPSHVTVVALLESQGLGKGTGPQRPSLSSARARDLLNRVAQHAESASRGDRVRLVRRLTVDPDQAADAGEVVAFGSEYAVGFRARYVSATGDTLLITGVAATDPDLRELRWIIRPQRLQLHGGMISRTSAGVRYSVQGVVSGAGAATPLLLLHEIADVSARDSRATAVDPVTRRVVAVQPLALRCP